MDHAVSWTIDDLLAVRERCTEDEAKELSAWARFLAGRLHVGPTVERVLVTASRTWGRTRILRLAVEMIPDHATVVHGAARGGDTLVDQVCRWRGLRTEAHPVRNWYSRAAGFDRNERMCQLGADVGLAFHRGSSPGTADCMARMTAHGIHVFTFRQEA